jgi:solute carrier family 36 (proton-coupled amino acid transporter)
MSQDRSGSSPAQPRSVLGSSPRGRESQTVLAKSPSRGSSIARLASPVPSSLNSQLPRQIPTPSQLQGGSDTPLAGPSSNDVNQGPSRSALAAALESNYGKSPPRYGTPPVRMASPPPVTSASTQEVGRYGSFGAHSHHRGSDSAQRTIEDPEIVRRHLVQSTGESSRSARQSISQSRGRTRDVAAPDLDDFSSLQLQVSRLELQCLS